MASIALSKPFLSINLPAENLTIHHYPSKLLSIQHGQGKGAVKAEFSDMHQYHKEAIDETATDVGHCIAKAVKAQETGTEIYEALHSIGLQPKSLASPISAYEEKVLSNIDLPTIDHIPDGPDELAAACCHGGWVEAFHIGHWPIAYDYDINCGNISAAVGAFAVTPTADLLLLGMKRVRVEAPELFPLLRAQMAAWSPEWVGVEDTGPGKALVQAASREGISLRPLTISRNGFQQ